ncbi:MAG: hypothetical protein ACOY0T_05925 [Myxococcota bacterium]
MRGALGFGITVAAVTGFASIASAQCEYDSECGSDSVCDAGRCRTRPPRAEPDDSGRLRKSGKRIGKPGLMAAGIVLAASGPVVMTVGLLTTHCNSPGSTCNVEQRLLLFGLAGGALIGIGVPLIVMGAKRVPERQVILVPSISPERASLSVQLTL